jgi:hypothetical protein
MGNRYRLNTALALATVVVLGCLVLLLIPPLREAISQQRARRVLSSGASIKVGPKGDLQAAINAAKAGDTIVLEAGATYTGPFTLPKKAGDDYITIHSSAASQLPEGQRVSPSQSALLARLLSATNGEPVIKTNPGAHHFRFVGIEIAPASTSMVVYTLIALGSAGGEQDTPAEVPHHLIFDRCYIHGLPGLDTQRGIALNSAETTVSNSYISAIHGRGYDTQALGGWNGPGPFHIINNYLEGAGENIMFGGAAASVPNLIPSDIEIRRNHIFKPLSWKMGDPTYAGYHWTIKNLLELKNAQRVVIEGNVLENNWPDAQVGIGVVFTPRGENGHNPWATVRDITFSNNILRNSAGGINMLGRDDSGPSQRQTNIIISNNLFENIGSAPLFQVNGVAGLTLEHNTGFQAGNIMMLYGERTNGFVYRNNITRLSGYGVFGDGLGSGTAALEGFCPGYIFVSNLLIGGDRSGYPGNNFYPSSIQEVGFTDFQNRNYQLSAKSRFKRKATNGKDPGIDFEVLKRNLEGVILSAR